MADNKEKLVGDKRKFSFSDQGYTIREVLDNPSTQLLWTWKSGICPNCKIKLDRNVNHQFYRIEILGLDGIADKDLLITDIQIVGDTLDRRRMLLPADKYNEVFNESKLFKHLAKVV